MKTSVSRAGAVLFALALAGAIAPSALAQQNSTVAEIERYRQMLQDGNPADLVSAKGEGMWKARRGPRNPFCKTARQFSATVPAAPAAACAASQKTLQQRYADRHHDPPG